MKIYLTGSTKNKNLFNVYSQIKNAFSMVGHEVLTPLDTIEYGKTHSVNERLKRALTEIKQSDWIISEVSEPSSGQGFELGYLYANKSKNVILISNKLENVSGILLAAFGQPIIYNESNLSELISQLKQKISV